MSDERIVQDAMVQRAIDALSAPEQFDDQFERSLVAAIRAERPLARNAIGGGRPRRFTGAWWAAPNSIRMSPVAGLAVAAGVAAIAVAGTLGVAHRAPLVAVAAAPAVHDTVTFVRFVFVGRAKSVTLVGDFNRWGGDRTALSQTASGAWSVSVPVTNGRHEYAFIVDGKRWVADPLAPTTTDDFDTKSSIITVGT